MNTSPEAVRSQDWVFYPHLVVRQAGFPSEWLHRLKAPRTAKTAAALAAVGLEQEACKKRLLNEAFPAAVEAERQKGSPQGLRLLSTLRSRLGKGILTQSDLNSAAHVADPAVLQGIAYWLGLREKTNELRAEGECTIGTEFAQVRTAMYQLAHDPHIHEALYLTNPDFYQGSFKDYLRFSPGQKRTSKTKSLERRLMAYFQRFCAKNDTASFFGPMNTAQALPDLPTALSLVRSEGHWQRREAFLAFWAVSALARKISQEPDVRSWLVPRVHPLVRLEQSTVRFESVGKQVRLNAEHMELLLKVDGKATIGQIVDGLSLPAEAVFGMIERLVRANVLICQIEIPSTVFHPLSWLIDHLHSFPNSWQRKEYWCSLLDRLESLRRAFVVSGLEQRIRIQEEVESIFTAATEIPSRRLPGEMYADRTLLYEECLGTIHEFKLGPDFVRDMKERLATALELCAAYGTVLRRYYQNAARTVYEHLAPGGEPVPYLRLIRALQQAAANGELDSLEAPVREFAATLSELTASRADGHVTTLNREDLEHLLSLGQGGLIDGHTSPDLMLSAPSLEALVAGQYKLVLGEVHQFIYVWGSQLYFYDQWPEAQADLEALLAKCPTYANIATVLQERKHKGLLHESFPGTILQVSAPASDQARSVIRAADLQVTMADGELILTAEGQNVPLRIYTGGDEQLHLWAFALPRIAPVPVSCGTHTPRLEIGGVVYQRERWDLAVSELLPTPNADLLDTMASLWMAKERHGFPSHFFARVPDEKKPIYVDLESPISVEWFQGLLQRNQTVTISEMLPDFDGLWLRDSAGSYCCELRTLLFRIPDGGAQ